MKRDERLKSLSRDHHHALVLARRATAEGHAAPPSLATELAATFEREIEPHFRVEEEVLLPALRAKGRADLVDRTVREHEELRTLALGAREGRTGLLEELGTLLTAHVRFEERELFPACEAVLEASILEQARSAGAL